MPRVKQKVLDQVSTLYDNVSLFKDEAFLKTLKGKWHTKVFGNKNPIILEVGMGNGGFLQQMIQDYETQELSFNYIGVEIREFRLWKALRKNKVSVESGILKLVATRAQNLKNFFKKGEVSRIHLNFSDPWPKNKHERHRLTSPEFLKIFHHILMKHGEIVMKTDNDMLYEYSLSTFPKCGFEIIEHSSHVHDTSFEVRKWVTEFESKFIKKGKKINYIRVKRI
ncbi:tRNA (guanosine(46)-N7)-methyltransferase TrmB [Candidatus Falkowbacteria bacterium]|nr:tRNA (guanosine(46)-N7)-methyltransferase TrmB [Candidatus Falkowbacteria bacterium]